MGLLAQLTAGDSQVSSVVMWCDSSKPSLCSPSICLMCVCVRWQRSAELPVEPRWVHTGGSGIRADPKLSITDLWNSRYEETRAQPKLQVSACSFSALDTLLPVLSTYFTGTTRNSTKIGLGIVVPSSWPHGPCHVKVSWGGHWCTVPLTSPACMHTGKLALWCSMVSWRDVETVCKTPVTLKAGNSWETLHKKQNFLP